MSHCCLKLFFKKKVLKDIFLAFLSEKLIEIFYEIEKLLKRETDQQFKHCKLNATNFPCQKKFERSIFFIRE